MGIFINDIFVVAEGAVFTPRLAALYVACSLQLFNGGADRPFALQTDLRKSGYCIVPVRRQPEHLGQQPNGLQADTAVIQMIVGHYGEVGAFLDSYNCHKTPDLNLI